MAELYLRECERLQGGDRFIWRHHADGKTYEEILELYNSKYEPISIWTLYYRMQNIIADCRAWNIRSPNGYLYKEPSDAE
jgi:hypothetical protein